MRKVLAILPILLLIHAVHALAFEQPRITARSAILYDQDTGRVLYSKNVHEKLPMASTTKIMTAIMALEAGKLDDVVTISTNAAHTSGSSVDLEVGEEKTMEELVFGLMLRSGNDAGVAIAEHLAGSVEKFAEKMTKRAGELGAVHTSFKNPHGLHHEDHYTTAYDMAVISAHALSMPKFLEIITTQEKKISWTGRPYDRLLRNQNRLLSMYEGAEGIKTGWTTPAGRCFVGAASRDGWRLITVVLNAPQMWEDTIRLFDFGYEHYKWTDVIEKGQTLKTAAVTKGAADKVMLVAGDSVGLPLRENEAEILNYRFDVREPLTAPLRAGENVGVLHIYFGNQIVGTLPVVTGEAVEGRGLRRLLQKIFGRFALFSTRVTACT